MLHSKGVRCNGSRGMLKCEHIARPDHCGFDWCIEILQLWSQRLGDLEVILPDGS